MQRSPFPSSSSTSSSGASAGPRPVETPIDRALRLYEGTLDESNTPTHIKTWHLIILRNFLENFLPEIGCRVEVSCGEDKKAD